MHPTITFDPRQKLLTIVIPGDLKSTTVPDLQPDIERALIAQPPSPESCQVVRLDLAAAGMVDSMGLNLIVKICKHAQAAGARVQVIYGHPNILRTLLFTRLDRHVELVNAGIASEPGA